MWLSLTLEISSVLLLMQTQSKGNNNLPFKSCGPESYEIEIAQALNTPELRLRGLLTVGQSIWMEGDTIGPVLRPVGLASALKVIPTAFSPEPDCLGNTAQQCGSFRKLRNDRREIREPHFKNWMLGSFGTSCLSSPCCVWEGPRRWVFSGEEVAGVTEAESPVSLEV